MKFDYKSYSDHLESENERLNAIIDELEEKRKYDLCFISHLKEDKKQLKDKIYKAIEFCYRYLSLNLDDFDTRKLLEKILEILGDKE